ncbi:hypothetical protein [Roseateles sp. LYH14W]|uniref:Glycosyl transferase n=1 Tax=Pelomonas parva TaxID=3299032 RepID=A0ABW7F614_9BURK
MDAALFTICSRNYLGQARTLMQSVRAHEPDAKRYIVVVDRKSELPPLDTDLAEIVWAEELPIADFERKAFIFDVLELNTNVKPSAFLQLLKSHERCIYMDPDTVLYDSLAPVWAGLDSANVVLTPHTIVPRDGLDCPWEQDLLRYGGYNLGFAAVRRSDESVRMLRWWEDRCLSRGFHAPTEGFFVDQKFMDLASMFFDGVQPVRHSGLNVAYWNLHERTVRFDGNRYFVGDQPLIFCHFSGFVFEPTAEERDLITKYPCDQTLASRPELRGLCDDYRQRLKDNDHAKLKKIPYSFARFDNGRDIPKVVRRLVALGTLQADSAALFCSDSDFYRRLDHLRLLPRPHAGGGGAARVVKARQEVQARFAEGLMRRLMLVIGVSRYERILRLLERLASPFNQSFLVPDAERKPTP